MISEIVFLQCFDVVLTLFPFKLKDILPFKMNGLKYSEITSGIIRASMNVHNTLGCGFQELIYQRALAIEMQRANIPHAREVSIPISYRGEIIGERRVDFLVENKISVEIKALVQLEPVHIAQAKNYIEAFDLDVGLLINFGSHTLEFRRLERWDKKFN